MTKKDKLMKRLLSEPKDFTYEELKSLLLFIGYEERNKGKTSGSRVAFYKPHFPMIILHKPHGRKELLAYQIKAILETLREMGEIDG